MHRDMRMETEKEQVVRWQSPGLVLRVFFLLSFVVLTLTALAMIATAQEESSQNAVRLLRGLGGLSFGVGVGALALAWQAGRNHAWAERMWQWMFGGGQPGRILGWLAGLAWAGSSLLSLTPSERFGRWANYHAALLPMLLGVAVTSGMVTVIVVIQTRGLWVGKAGALMRRQSRAWKVGLAFFASMLVIWWGIAWTGYGIRPDKYNWYGAGTPVLFQQVLVCLLAAGIAYRMEGRFAAWVGRVSRSRLSPDLVVFALIWVVAALVWALPHASAGWWAPPAVPPNYELYPLADAMRFDLGGQYALIGQGFNNGQFYYRVLYEGFLFVLHELAGQEVEKVVTLQAMLFAVFPALVYLLGKNLQGRTLGVLAAGMVICTGYNSIVASEIVYLATPKQMLTDFPTAIGLAGFTLLLVLWLKEPERLGWLFWAAGVLGVTALVRTSALGLLPLLLLGVWILPLRPRWGKIGVTVLVLAVFLAAALPWSSFYGRLVTDMYSTKVSSVIDTRLIHPDIPNPKSQSMLETPIPEKPGGVIKRASAIEAIVNHFGHNLVTSVLVLPPTPAFQKVQTVVQEFPYWNPSWDGKLTLAEWGLIFINLLFLALGIGAVIQRAGGSGVAPLLVFLTYSAINSGGRTSGARYSAPMDWILLFYYACGVLLVLYWIEATLGKGEGTDGETRGWKFAQVDLEWKTLVQRALPAFLVLGGVSAGIILASVWVPRRYAVQSQDQLMEKVLNSGYAQKMDIDETALRTFLAEEQAGIWYGRALYPRYYLKGHGVEDRIVFFRAKEYPRLTFILIGPNKIGPNVKNLYVELPSAPPKYFPNASDVIVLGCRVDADVVTALKVIVLGEKQYTYSVPSTVALHCPLELK